MRHSIVFAILSAMKPTETDAVAEYVAEVTRLAKTGKTTEHSFRGALAALIDALAPGLKAVNEPKRTDCGAPDYIVQDRTGLAVFYVEAKDLGDGDLDGKKRTVHKEQFDRYKAALDTIIFTDYLDFRLYRHGQFVSAVRIADWDGEDKVSGKPDAYDGLTALIADAAAGEPQKIDGAKRLAELMAGKARMLQTAAYRYLKPLAEAWDNARDGEAHPRKTPLLDMMLDFRKMLMPTVGADEFSDIFAQTLTYGMFAARLNDHTPETFSRAEATELIPKTNPFLKKLFWFIASDLEDELTWMVDDLVDLFRAAAVADIMRGYGKAQGGADPMLHFYEDFLAAYDGDLRKKRGVWYTPIQVVRFIVAAADWALRTRFGLPDGLADSSKTEIEVEETAFHGKKLAQKVKKTVHRVQLLDPATGTGTFIAAVVRLIFSKFAGNEGLWPSYVENDLLPRLNGFELLMASYTMAHIKLDMTLRECCQCGNVANTNSNSQLGTGNIGTGNIGNNSHARFRIFLTDSLSDWHKELPGGLFAAALGAEQEGADEVKRDIPVMVVVGNPPYSGESQNKGEWIMRLMEDYKVEPGGKERLKERNPKWLNDDYVKFIRLAEHYVEKNGEGIVAYITPHGFLDNPTFRGMRWHLMQTFSEIWTLNLHGNSKKKEVAPDGGKDECVFDIMQGVAITLFVKTGRTGVPPVQEATGVSLPRESAPHRGSGALAASTACHIYYSDLWGKKAAKLAALDSATMDTIDWQELHPTEPMLFFTPRDTTGEEEWNAAFGIAELMPVNSSGVVSANDELNFSFSEEEQRAKIKDLLSLSEHDWRQKYHRPKDSRDWAYAYAKEDAKRTGNFCKAAYRVFDDRFTFYTGTSKGLYTNPRDMVMRHFILQNSKTPNSESNKTSASLRFCVENGHNIGLVCLKGFPKESPPAFVTDAITEHRYWSCSGMQGTDYIFPLYLYEENMGKVERRANLDKNIVAKIAAAVGGDDWAAETTGIAETTGTDSVSRMSCSSRMSRNLTLTPIDIFDYIYGMLHSPTYRMKFKEFLKSDFPRIPYPKNAEEFARYRDAGRELRMAHLMLGPQPPLFEPTARFPVPGDNVVDAVRWDNDRVYINPTQYFDNVPLAAYEQAIGGYHPAEKWLKDRKGRALTQDDLRHYQRIILALDKTRNVMEGMSHADESA